MQISDSIVLVTGAARRIGRAIALELGRRGAHLAIHYRSSGKDASETVRLIRQLGVDAEAFAADLTDEQARAGLFEQLDVRFGRVDVLINNASVFGPGTLEETTPALWREQMETNAEAPFFMAQAAGELMLATGGGKIINIADPAGEVIWTNYFSYSVSKAALLAVTQGLSRALAPAVQVNAVAPGPVHFPEYYTDEQKQHAVERTLLKRAGTPEDVVRAVVFLIENDYVTGEVLHVDGGRHVL
jgi:NAD(P)-dependent dehydrogenase (short-subunit alcohol dehydrogenase family)